MTEEHKGNLPASVTRESMLRVGADLELSVAAKDPALCLTAGFLLSSSVDV